MHWNDVRYALRLMRRNRGFTAVAVLSIALGIGANTAIFSLFDAVMVRTLPVSHPEQLVEFIQVYPGEPRGIGYWTWETYQHFRQHTRAFSDITGTSFDNVALVRTEDAEAEALVVENVLGNYFGMLGLKPAAGRLLGPDDVEVSGSGEAVVVSHSYWTTRLHGDRAAIGKRIWIGKNPKTIVGVAPSGYVGPRVGSRTDIWTAREKDNVALLGRLQPNATIEQARAEMHVLFPFAIEQRAARSNDPLVRKMRFELEHAGRGFARVRDQYGKPLTLLLAVVGLLLVLACINLAGLLLARSASRRRELAVRVGLGASSGQLIRQMLTESLLLSGTGAVIGILLAYAGTATLVRIIASGRAHERIELNIQPNLQVLLFTVFVAILTGIVFGLAPAWYASRFTPPNSSLRHSGRAGDAPIWRIFGRALVAVQVSLSILLVTSSAVFLTHLIRLRNFDLGFRSDHVLLIQLDPSGSGYKPGQLGTRYAQLLSQLRAIPGAQSAAIAACTPIQGCGASRFVSTQGFVERPEDRRFTTLSWVSPSYFETMGVPLLAGRDFSFADASRSRVAIVSQAMARYYFPGQNAIGKYIQIDKDPRTGGWYGTDDPYEIIGVAGDAKYTELREPPPRTMYLNMFQENRIAHQFALRTSVEPAAVATAARAEVRRHVSNVRIARVTTLTEQVDAALVPERLIATLTGYFGTLGAVLAGIGLYGLLAYTVTRRTNEIGVRMALGATSAHIRRMVAMDALVMVGGGIAIGTAMVAWSKPLASSLIQDLKPEVPTALALAGAAIIGVAVVASYAPARRASRVDPLVALRHD